MTKWAAILFQSIGMRAMPLRNTKAEAEKDAKEWRKHVAGLKRKPQGKMYVITEAKLEAMAWSCAVSPHTTPEEDRLS